MQHFRNTTIFSLLAADHFRRSGKMRMTPSPTRTRLVSSRRLAMEHENPQVSLLEHQNSNWTSPKEWRRFSGKITQKWWMIHCLTGAKQIGNEGMIWNDMEWCGMIPLRVIDDNPSTPLAKPCIPCVKRSRISSDGSFGRVNRHRKILHQWSFEWTHHRMNMGIYGNLWESMGIYGNIWRFSDFQVAIFGFLKGLP